MNRHMLKLALAILLLCPLCTAGEKGSYPPVNVKDWKVLPCTLTEKGDPRPVVLNADGSYTQFWVIPGNLPPRCESAKPKKVSKTGK